VAGAASAAGQSGALLEVQDLNVRFDTADGTLHAVRGTSFEVRTGETLGIVGESGSGKSVTAQALLGLVPGADVTGHAWFEGHDLLAMNDAQLREIRGQRISMVFQDPLTSLHPLYKLGWQLTEAMRAHGTVSRAAASRRAVELLGMVGIPRPAERLDDYPHQFSGGMRQRVMIAMALSLDPALIIADEPTTALDATVQAQVLELLVKLQGELGTSLVLITHDLGVVADLADHVMVMYSGAPVEQADRRPITRRTTPTRAGCWSRSRWPATPGGCGPSPASRRACWPSRRAARSGRAAGSRWPGAPPRRRRCTRSGPAPATSPPAGCPTPPPGRSPAACRSRSRSRPPRRPPRRTASPRCWS
jgi:ABC-type dipeptide/oligopeptide/nickel transport system ATPase component